MIGPSIIKNMLKKFQKIIFSSWKYLIMIKNFPPEDFFLRYFFFSIFSALWTLDQLAVYTFFFHGLVQLDLLIDPHFWNSVRSLHWEGSLTPPNANIKMIKEKWSRILFWPEVGKDLPYILDSQWMERSAWI